MISLIPSINLNKPGTYIAVHMNRLNHMYDRNGVIPNKYAVVRTNVTSYRVNPQTGAIEDTSEPFVELVCINVARREAFLLADYLTIIERQMRIHGLDESKDNLGSVVEDDRADSIFARYPTFRPRRDMFVGSYVAYNRFITYSAPEWDPSQEVINTIPHPTVRPQTQVRAEETEQQNDPDLDPEN